MKLPCITKRRLVPALVIWYLGFSLLYLACGNIPERFMYELPASAIDQMIPLLPWTVWIYQSQIILLTSALFLSKQGQERDRYFYALCLVSLFSFSFFLIFPTMITRPEMEFVGLTGELWKALLAIDAPTNCFPSLHVALALLAAVALFKRGKIWRYVGPAWALVIFISTLTTKQHVVLDVAGGLLFAGVGWCASGYICRFISFESDSFGTTADPTLS